MSENLQNDMNAETEMLSAAEGRVLINERAQALLGISGVEFVQRYHTGDLADTYNDPAHHLAVNRLVMLLPFWHED